MLSKLPKKLLLTILILLASVSYSSAQKIEDIAISNSTICAGEEITVTFLVENGKKDNDQFTSSTIYTIDLGTQQDKDFSSNNIPLNFTSDSTPDPENKATKIISQAFLIPEDIPAGDNYTFLVSSSNPNIDDKTKKKDIILFKVFAKPLTPSVSNNGPICKKETLRLSGNNNETDVTYTWTGPNGFTSSDQNPIITSATTAMNGDYTVSVTNNTTGCVSNPVTQTILVKDENLWTGSIDSNWNNIGNWDCARIPDLNEIVRIPTTDVTNYPVLNSGLAGQCKDIIIEGTASLVIINNTLEVSGSISNNGTFDAGNATIEMKGNSLQTIPNTPFLNNRIENLRINNSSGVELTSDLEITGILYAQKGNFNSNGYLKLISNSTQTALIDGFGTGEIIGNVTIQRYIDPAFGYKYLGSPFSNTIVGDFDSYINLNSEFSSIFNYNEKREDADGNDLSGWEAYTGAYSPFNIMEGYALNFGADDGSAIIDISGTVNNGGLSRSLSTSNGEFTKGFHLVSNPYPSPIDWNMVPDLSTNIDAAAYFFRADASDEFEGAYTSVVADISSSGSPGSIIPSMQGFFIHATEGSTNSVLRMNNGIRINDFSQEFYRGQETPSNRTLIRISAGFENENFSDPLVVYFDSSLSLDFEKNRDALKLYNSNKDLPNFYSITEDGKETSINGISKPEVKNNFRLPLGVKTEKSGNLIIQHEDLENFPGDFHLFLIDQDRRISVNLKERGYKLNLEKGEYKNRFFLLFSAANSIDPSILFNDPFSLMNTSKEIGIRMNLKEKESGQLRISSINGQLLKLMTVNANEEISFRDMKSTGVYLVSFISNNRKFSKKVIVRK